MKLGQRGLKLIKEFEGFSAKPYRDPVGVWTIGYGSTAGVNANTPAMSEKAASERLQREVEARYGKAVNDLNLPLNQNQHDALTSFVYNLGPGAIAANTGIGKALRKREWGKAGDEMLRWDKAGGRTLPGLTRRRQAERQLFLSAAPAAPAKPNLSVLEPHERKDVETYDRLNWKDHPSGRRKVQDRLVKYRKDIWRAADKEMKHGKPKDKAWSFRNRKQRYDLLWSRTPNRK